MALDFTPVTELPEPPQKTDPTNFAEKADAFLVGLADFGPELNLLVAELNKLTSGLDQASPIEAYDNGSTYSFPDVVAGSDGASYRCIDINVTGVDPVTDDGSNWYNLSGPEPVVVPTVPPGTTVPFFGGYFTNGANAGFTSVVGNTVAEVNAYVNPYNFYVSNGAAPNDPDSPIWNAPDRYLPNITDDRFLMGDLVAGSTGGSNTMSHTHTTGSFTLTSSHMPSHRHGFARGTCGSNGSYGNIWGSGCSRDGTWYTDYAGSGSAHNHGSTGGATNTNNMPKYLGCIYITRVK